MHARHLDGLAREAMYQTHANSRHLSHAARGVMLVVRASNGSTMRVADLPVHAGDGRFFCTSNVVVQRKTFVRFYLRIVLTNTRIRANIALWEPRVRGVVQQGRGLGSSRFPSIEGPLHAVREARWSQGRARESAMTGFASQPSRAPRSPSRRSHGRARSSAGNGLSSHTSASPLRRSPSRGRWRETALIGLVLRQSTSQREGSRRSHGRARFSVRTGLERSAPSAHGGAPRRTWAPRPGQHRPQRSSCSSPLRPPWRTASRPRLQGASPARAR